ncbi:hypothetical protein ACLOJK_032309 [Asimina triloba]
MSFSSAASSASAPAPRPIQDKTLIPGLPDDIAALILSLIPFSHRARLKLTSRSWQAFLSSHQPFLLLRSSIRPTPATHPNLLCIFPQDPSLTSPFLFDPARLAWTPLPFLPCSPHCYGRSNFLAVALGPYLYLLGGSLFDVRSFPIDRPRSSAAAYRLDLPTSSSPSASWTRLPSMISPRGSFACAADPETNSILVAGGGSRHTLFGAAGTRMSSAERFDVGRGEWVPEEGLPRFRAGCVGFIFGDEFWVMGGYGDYRMLSGVFPVDEHYLDAVALNLKTGKWRALGEMRVEGEWSGRLGRIALVDGVYGEMPGIFMLDCSTVFRYDIASNVWRRETELLRKLPDGIECGFVSLGGELYVMFVLRFDLQNQHAMRKQPERKTIFIQAYDPRKRTWRHMITKTPFCRPVDFKTTVMCTIRA